MDHIKLFLLFSLTLTNIFGQDIPDYYSIHEPDYTLNETTSQKQAKSLRTKETDQNYINTPIDYESPETITNPPHLRQSGHGHDAKQGGKRPKGRPRSQGPNHPGGANHKHDGSMKSNLVYDQILYDKYPYDEHFNFTEIDPKEYNRCSTNEFCPFMKLSYHTVKWDNHLKQLTQIHHRCDNLFPMGPFRFHVYFETFTLSVLANLLEITSIQLLKKCPYCFEVYRRFLCNMASALVYAEMEQPPLGPIPMPIV